MLSKKSLLNKETLLVNKMSTMSLQPSSMEVINFLEKRWRSKKDSEGKRLVNKILSLYKHYNPILEASLRNDCLLLDQKLQEENSSEKPLIFWFETACICGSEIVVHHLLNQYQFDPLDSFNAVAYALSSGKKDFAYDLALTLKSKGLTSPGNILLFSLGNYDMGLEIKNLFSNDYDSEKLSNEANKMNMNF